MISNKELISLSQKFGTPLYVLDETIIRQNCNLYKTVLYKNFGKNAMALFASKALSCVEFCKIIDEEGLGLDVVSEGELYTAFMAKFHMGKIHFHGNNKSLNELKMALQKNVSKIVVDNFEELKTLATLAHETNKHPEILLRVRPGVSAKTHSSILTGILGSKFGFALEEIEDVLKFILKTNLKFCGIHCHIGSQIFKPEPFVNAAEIMMNLIAKIYNKFKIQSEFLNLGGGIGVRYVETDPLLNPAQIISAVAKKIKNVAEIRSIQVPFVFFEPGRSIVAEAGTTIYTVGCVKKVFGNKIYAIVDGSMADNPRFALYRAKYRVTNLSRENDESNIQSVTVAGKCCESGDIIAQDTKIKQPYANDLLAVHCTGAYNYSMASNYNRLCRPALILAGGSKVKILARRQNLDDLLTEEIFLN
ncbi:MAG: diaminopimelate decarboxylase [Oscillospiraceae bacterium]|jgi:diaminopimelate decarboxylase|nr:diaminopimelate decarboxylase [Oscillospiraceae bacterium]